MSPEDLSVRAVQTIKGADVLVGGKRHLAFFPEHRGQKIIINRDIEAAIRNLKKIATNKKIVVIASGDPNFYGIGGHIITACGKQNVSIIPNITAFQAAFARIREPWEDASCISLHGRPIAALDTLASSGKTAAIYCDGNNSPAAVARYLIDQNRTFKNSHAWIFENLSQADEKISRGKLGKFTRVNASPLSLMIIKTTPHHAPDQGSATLGIADHEFYHQRGMITKSDIRILSLARLGCGNGSVLWDIGAGSGSFSIEAARLYPSLSAYAIEQKPARFRNLKRNIVKFKTGTVHACQGSAPEALKALPAPTHVFIGGSGGNLVSILEAVQRRILPHGSVVLTCVMLDTLNTAIRFFKHWNWQYTVAAVQIANLSGAAMPEIFRSENPVFIVHGTKEKK
jgi:precorrin-6Y C5,15-methyltransferase (decarboxylating)